MWDALCDTPAEAAEMTQRSELLLALQTRVRSWGADRGAAADRLGITRRRVDELLKGKIGAFDLDALAELAARAGLPSGGRAGGATHGAA